MIKIFLLFCALEVILHSGAVNVKFDMKKYFRINNLKLEYWSPEYLELLNVSSRLYNQNDPLNYINFHVITKYPSGNNITLHVFTYELLSNQYKRSFVELHSRLCDLQNHLYLREVLTPALKKAFGGRPIRCPFPEGEYNFQNMTLPVINNFPFPKGRASVNFTRSPTKDVIVHFNFNFEIFEMKIKKN